MLELLKRWTCDLCKAVALNDDVKGWRWFKRGTSGSIQHACPSCEKSIPEMAASALLGRES